MNYIYLYIFNQGKIIRSDAISLPLKIRKKTRRNKKKEREKRENRIDSLLKTISQYYFVCLYTVKFLNYKTMIFCVYYGIHINLSIHILKKLLLLLFFFLSNKNANVYIEIK